MLEDIKKCVNEKYSINYKKMCYYYIASLKKSLVNTKSLKLPKYKRPFSIDYRERGTHTRGKVSHTGYLTHGNSRGEARKRSRHKNYSSRVECSMK